MSRFFARYFAWGAAGLFFCLSGSAVLQAADGKLYLLDYEDAAVSPRARVINLTERLKRLARQSIPGRKDHPMREIFVVLSRGGMPPPFTFRTDRRGNLRITLPDTYEKLLAEPGALPRLTGWFLFGRSGKNPDLEKHFRNSWFTVGFSRKLLGEMTPGRTPFARYYFPAAYALTSAGRYPALQSLLEQPLRPEDTTLRLIYEEYCELLVMICARNGLFKAGLLARMLDALEKSPERKDMPDLFRSLARRPLEQKEPRTFPPGLNRQQLQAAYESWFRQELDELLNGNFLPASAGKIEMRYLAAVHFESRLKTTDGKEEKEKTIRGGLRELIHCYSRLETPEKTAHGIIAGLTRLIPPSPPDLKIPVSNVRNALQTFVDHPSQESGSLLLAAEQNFFRALEKNLVLEQFLSETEQECVTPAARYYLTFRLIDYEKRSAAQLLPRLAGRMKQIEEETGK